MTFAATTENFSGDPTIVYSVKFEDGEYTELTGNTYTPDTVGNYTVKAVATYEEETAQKEQAFDAIDIIEESDSYYTSDDKRVEYIYHVIVGSYANVKNAYNVSKKFSEKGMNNYVAVSDKGLHRIFYYSSDNVDSVIEKYKEAKKSISDAWILKLKKN